MENQPLPVVIMWIDQHETIELNPVAFMLKEQTLGILPYARVSVIKRIPCRIVNQQIQMGALSLWLQKVEPKETMLLLPQTNKRNIILHFMMGNDVTAQIKDNKRVVLCGGFMDMFNLTSYPNKALLKEGQDFVSLHVNIEPRRVKEAVKLFPELEFLKSPKIMQADGPVRGENEPPLPIGDVCKELISDILTCRYVADHAHYFLQRAAVNMFTIYDKLMTGPRHNLSEKNLQRVKKCFEFLQKYYAGQHWVTQLSAMFGLHPKVLHEGFEALYGCRISSFQYMLRMRDAYHRLIGTPDSLEEIAWRTGFGSTGSFMMEFRAYYKCDPILLRKAR